VSDDFVNSCHYLRPRASPAKRPNIEWPLHLQALRTILNTWLLGSWTDISTRSNLQTKLQSSTWICPLTKSFSFANLASIQIRKGSKSCFSLRVMGDVIQCSWCWDRRENNFNFALSSHLFSVSGSGKTRLSLDGLCCHWGFYISCRTGRALAFGSKDFEESMTMLQTMSTWSEGNVSNNASVTHRALAILICARFFILKQLVQHLPLDVDIKAARRCWVLAQVLPPSLSHEGGDLFVNVVQGLRGARIETMLDIIHSLQAEIMTKRKDLFPQGKKTPISIVVDEVQMAANNLNFLPSGSGTDNLRPILREVVSYCESERTFDKIILSGTSLSEKMERAVGSLSAKQNPGKRIFTDVGCFTTEDPSHENYISQYLNLDNNIISDQRLLERMKYWFSGRYRLTASLIELFLHSGRVSPHRVLTAFAKHLTGFEITDAKDLEDDKPVISPDVQTKIANFPPLTDLVPLFSGPDFPNSQCNSPFNDSWTD
jgi:hypothetical protein